VLKKEAPYPMDRVLFSLSDFAKYELTPRRAMSIVSGVPNLSSTSGTKGRVNAVFHKLDLIFEKTGELNVMKKVIALSAVLVMGALGMACGDGGANNAAANANKTVANAMANANAAMANANAAVANATNQLQSATNQMSNAMSNAKPAGNAAAPATNGNANHAANK
jgi:hypothetical protein